MPKKRKTYHVVPDKDKGDWAVKPEGAERATSRHPTQKEAIEKARSIAENQPLGQIVIHKSDGTIREERTYGKDPYPPKG